MSRIGIFNSLASVLRAGCAALLVGLAGQAHAAVTGTLGEEPSAANGNTRTFTLTARQDFISTADGNSHYAWGYAHGTELPMQYPGPTLIVNQGDKVRIILNNALPVPVSIMFPGLRGVTAAGGNPGLLAREAPAVPVTQSGVVSGPTYTFTAEKAGTYLYHSGTNPDLQVEMGLVGALIVRPTGFVKESRATWKAYGNKGTEYDRETLFLLTEMDPAIHWQVYTQVFSNLPISVDTSARHATLWFINGRTGPDTELEEYVGWLPTQPYNALPRMHPGEKLLMRMVSAGRDLHPFHHHGNHATAIARDGQVLSTAPNDLTKVPNLGAPDFTVRAIPGQTMDLIYEWTGKNIGWDIYGTVAENPHTCLPDANGFHRVVTDKNYREWCGDHDKGIPVTIPGQLDLSYGESYSGSPFMGLSGSLPQGHPGLNTRGGYFHMWHSHNEKEVTNDNVFPGGMMTMLIIEPWTVSLDTEAGSGTVGGDEVTGPRDLAISNTNNVTSVKPGQGITYQVVVTNNGVAAVSGAVVAGVRPATLTAWSWSCLPVPTCGGTAASNTNQSSNINKTLGLLAPGASVTFTITATVPTNATVGSNLTSTMTVTGPVGYTDVDPANNSATDSDPIVARGAASFSPNSVAFGEVGTVTATRTITVTNSGPGTLRISTVAMTGNAGGRFTVQSETCTSAGEIAANGTCTVVVGFNNGTSNTTRNGTLTVTHDGTGPTTVSLSGS